MAEVTLTEAQNGGRVAVHVGDTIVIALAENAGGGYKWSAASIDAERVAVERQQYLERGQAIGSAGTAEWLLRAKRPGPARVELVKSRPWKPDEIADRFAVDLVIAA
jgi:predicted secreted protein